MVTSEGPKLYVEGKDDSHAISHLLRRHGIQSVPEISATDGRDPMLDAIAIRTREDLVTEGDLLLNLAKCSTRKARAMGATFPDAKRSKAVLHTWLAWQRDPGLPYGAAIKAQFFRHDSPAAQAFVAWYERLGLGQD